MYEVSHLNDAKGLANVIADGAQYKQIKGEDVEAIDRLLDVLHIARSLREDEFLISQLVATGIDGMACNAGQMIGAGLRREETDAARARTKKKVVELIGRLLDEAAAWEGLRRSVNMERLGWIEFCRSTGEGTWLIRPLAERNLGRTLFNFDIVYAASECRNAPEVRAKLERCSWENPGVADPFAQAMQSMFGGKGAKEEKVLPRYSRWFYMMKADPSGILERHFRVIAERRVTALALACQLYRIERGKWPARVDDLVPDYLSSVPIDPFRGDGGAVGYAISKNALRGGGDRPLVYYDPGGKVLLAPGEPTFGWVSNPRELREAGLREGLPVRQWRDLSVFDPKELKKAVEDNPKKSDAKWK
jgi:hypothetical protein